MDSPEKYLFLNKNKIVDCAQFTNYVYKEETGEDLGLPVRSESLRKDSEASIKTRERFVEVKEPEQHDIALMKVKKSKFLAPTHCGVVFVINEVQFILHYTNTLGIQLHTLSQLNERELEVTGYYRQKK